MSESSQTARMQSALWQNKARAARANAIPQLSDILSHPVSTEDFTTLSEFDTHMELCRRLSLDEMRFRDSERDAVLSRLRDIRALNRVGEALLFFGRSSDLGGLRVPLTPPPEVLLELLDWDGDDVFVFDSEQHLHVYIDRGEDWLRPEDFGVAPREMLIILNTSET